MDRNRGEYCAWILNEVLRQIVRFDSHFYFVLRGEF
jgi:hypothetical protein